MFAVPLSCSKTILQSSPSSTFQLSLQFVPRATYLSPYLSILLTDHPLPKFEPTTSPLAPSLHESPHTQSPRKAGLLGSVPLLILQVSSLLRLYVTMSGPTTLLSILQRKNPDIRDHWAGASYDNTVNKNFDMVTLSDRLHMHV